MTTEASRAQRAWEVSSTSTEPRPDQGTAQLTVEGEVGEITLNRPERLNAINDVMVAELHHQLDSAENQGVRALVVRGAGKGFCAGRDLADAEPGTEDASAILADSLNPVVAHVADFPAPTFAAVHGACMGTGLGIALACDLVYVARDAKIGSPFARIGAVLDSGAHHFFVARLGTHRALELIYTGRTLSGTEAEAWGLVNRSLEGDELLAEVRRVATHVAAGPTFAFMQSKRLVRQIAEEGLGLTEVLTREAAAQGAASKTVDYQEGISAFQEKRSPTFRGR